MNWLAFEVAFSRTGAGPIFTFEIITKQTFLLYVYTILYQISSATHDIPYTQTKQTKTKTFVKLHGLLLVYKFKIEIYKRGAFIESCYDNFF